MLVQAEFGCNIVQQVSLSPLFPSAKMVQTKKSDNTTDIHQRSVIFFTVWIMRVPCRFLDSESSRELILDDSKQPFFCVLTVLDVKSQLGNHFVFIAFSFHMLYRSKLC